MCKLHGHRRAFARDRSQRHRLQLTEAQVSVSYLGRWYDASCELPPGISETTIKEGEIERISRALSIVIFASSIPRRLGDVDSKELALDKSRCRRCAHALSQALAGWNGKKKPVLALEDEIRMKAAQLDWTAFAAEHETLVRQRCTVAVSWAVRNAKERWGRSAVVLYENEINWVGYALRD